MAGGRPRKEVDFDELKRLAEIHCTEEECAHVLEMSADTLALRIKEQFSLSFPEYVKRFAGAGKASLRRLQWESAQGGSIPMQIWLGKQWLGQAEKVVSDVREVRVVHVDELEQAE